MDERELQLLLKQPLTPHQPWAAAAESNLRPSLHAEQRVVRKAKVSLILPTYHNARLKQNSLVYLLENLDQSKAITEVVLAVGDGRAHEYLPFQSAFPTKRVKVIDSEPNQRSLSRNLGAAAASNELLLFMDDDMVVKDWRIIDVIASRMLVGGFEAAMFPRRTYIRFPVLFDPTAMRDLLKRFRSSGLRGDACYYDPYTEGSHFRSIVFCFPGCFMLIGKQTFKALGGFPQQYSGWGFEDAHFAVNAVSKLKVLNLFKKVDSLAHVDHPVTPYKAIELEKNYEQFLGSTNFADLESFCSRVLTGHDFPSASTLPAGKTSLLALPKVLKQRHHIPLKVSEVMQSCQRIAERRAADHADVNPKQVILYGSRADGSARVDSDYDLLVLFSGSGLKEFFVSWNGGAQVELEFSDYGTFEQMVRQPDAYGLQGLFELTKIVTSRWLWGDELEWQTWRRHMLDLACLNGRAYWIAFLLGLHLNQKNTQRFSEVQRALLKVLGEFTLPEDLPYIRDFEFARCSGRLVTLLDARTPTWRKDVKAGRKVFASQPPEIWRTLKSLNDTA